MVDHDLGWRQHAYERAARYRKTEALVAAIDRLAVERGVDPLRQPELVAEQLRKLSLLGWCEVADLAHVHAPSEATQAVVLEEYERRTRLAEHAAARAAEAARPARYGVYTARRNDVTGRLEDYPLGELTRDLSYLELLVEGQGETLPDGWEDALARGEDVEASGDCWIEVTR